MPDIGGALADGMPAVEVMSEYVRACRQLGYPVPELAAVRDAYLAEEGMDLGALDADCRSLSDAVAAAEEALRQQEAARSAVDAAWQGTGAVAASEVLVRHDGSAETAVGALRAAAASLGQLRYRLWQLVEAKVDNTIGIEGRVQGMRDAWLGASRTVTTGAGDRVSASELVGEQVAPFVAGDIGADWVAAMESTESGVRRAYDNAADAMTGEPAAVFGGRIGYPVVVPQDYPAALAPAGAPVPVAPAGYSAAPVGYSAAPVAPTGWSDPPPVAGPAAAAPSDAPPAGAPAMPSLGGLGGGLSPLGSGLSGMGQSLGDLLGGLLGSGDGGLADGLDTPDLGTDLDEELVDDEPEDLEGDLEDSEDSEDSEEEQDEEEDDEPADDEPPEEETVAEPAVAATADPVEPVEPQEEPPVPTPVPEPLGAAEAPPPAEPVPAATPCEIAADELPQAGPQADAP